jgi:hypothetical protein
MPNVEDYAIVVGINRYPGIRELFGAEKDASQFAKWLGDPQGGDLPPENIKLVLSSSIPSNFEPGATAFSAKPVKDTIDEKLWEIGIDEKDRVGRRLYFFFAGHGAAPSFDEVVLLMANASKERLSSNIGVRHYRDFLRKAASFDEVIIILDCCREFTTSAKPGEPVFRERLSQDRALLVRDVCIMGAGYGKKAFEPKVGEERRGLLTKALMEALKDRKAVVPPTNAITAASVVEYLKNRVPELAKDTTVEQNPEFSPNPMPDLILVGAPPATPQTKAVTRVIVDPALGGEVVLKTTNLDEIERRAAAQMPWQLELEPGVYVLTHLPSGADKVIDARKPQEVPDEYRFA